MFIRIISQALCFAMTFTLASCKDGDKDESYRIIKLVSFEGSVTYTRDDKTKDVYKNMNFESGDDLKTGEQSNATLALDSDKKITLAAQPEINMKAAGDEDDSRTYIDLKSGEILNEINEPLKSGALYEVKTSNATVGVKGTIFLVKAEDDRTIVYCEKGVVEIKSEEKTEQITANQAAVVENGTVSIVPVEEIKDSVSEASQQRFWGNGNNDETYGITNLRDGWSVEKTDSGEYILIDELNPNRKDHYDADGVLSWTEIEYPDENRRETISYTLVGDAVLPQRYMEYAVSVEGEEDLVTDSILSYTPTGESNTLFDLFVSTSDSQSPDSNDYKNYQVRYSIALDCSASLTGDESGYVYLAKLVFDETQPDTPSGDNSGESTDGFIRRIDIEYNGTYNLYKQEDGTYTLENKKNTYIYGADNKLTGCTKKSGDGKTYTECKYSYIYGVIPVIEQEDIFDSSTGELLTRSNYLAMPGEYDEEGSYVKAEYPAIDNDNWYVFALSITEYDGATGDEAGTTFLNYHVSIQDKAFVECYDSSIAGAQTTSYGFISDISEYI